MKRNIITVFGQSANGKSHAMNVIKNIVETSNLPFNVKISSDGTDLVDAAIQAEEGDVSWTKNGFEIRNQRVFDTMQKNFYTRLGELNDENTLYIVEITGGQNIFPDMEALRRSKRLYDEMVQNGVSESTAYDSALFKMLYFKDDIQAGSTEYSNLMEDPRCSLDFSFANTVRKMDEGSLPTEWAQKVFASVYIDADYPTRVLNNSETEGSLGNLGLQSPDRSDFVMEVFGYPDFYPYMFDFLLENGLPRLVDLDNRTPKRELFASEVTSRMTNLLIEYGQEREHEGRTELHNEISSYPSSIEAKGW